MKTIGFVISQKENEKRRALIPDDIINIEHKDKLYFEEGYGQSLGISDDAYRKIGANITSRDQVLLQDIVCDPKIGEAEYLNQLQPSQSIFGWVHVGPDSQLEKLLVEKKIKVIAWEDMFEDGRHVFWENNKIAGEAAILHALTLFGQLPKESNVALIGKGNVSMGAYEILSSLGANVTIFDRKTLPDISKHLNKFDIIVNGILWDKTRTDHIIYKEDLKKMRSPSMIVDVSCDEEGAIETSRPTSFDNPIYTVDNVIHYAVDHTPTIFHHSATKSISHHIATYVDYLIEDRLKENQVLSNAVIIDDGKVIK